MGNAKGTVESKYDDAKARAAALQRDAEAKIKETKGAAANKYGEAKGAAEGTAQEAKKGWFSWLGWGKVKAEDAQDAAVREKDAARRSLAGSVADKAETTRQWAEGKKG